MLDVLHVTEYVISAKSQNEAADMATSHEEDLMFLEVVNNPTIEDTDAIVSIDKNRMPTHFYKYRVMTVEPVSELTSYRYASQIIMFKRLL